MLLIAGSAALVLSLPRARAWPERSRRWGAVGSCGQPYMLRAGVKAAGKEGAAGHGLCDLGSSPSSQISVSSVKRFLNCDDHGPRSGPSHSEKLCVWMAPQWSGGGRGAGSRCVCAWGSLGRVPGDGGRGDDGRPAPESTHRLWQHGLTARPQSGPNPQPLESGPIFKFVSSS